MGESNGSIKSGQKFNKLTVDSYHHTDKNFKNHWLCHCECGNTTIVIAGNLKNGNTTSCGCQRGFRSKSPATHNDTDSTEYKSWACMLSRCNNKNIPVYKNYGGRGIKVCDRWHNYSLFLEDMGRKPSMKHSLHRIDNNMGYCPQNCEWADDVTQANATRRNVFLTVDGETKSITQWAKHLGIPRTTIQWRHNAKWTDEECVKGR